MRVLLIGCGDVARRLVPLLPKGWRLYGLLRDPAQRATWRQLGVIPIPGDLDRASSLRRLAGLAECVIHLAPPPSSGTVDARTRHLLAALAKGRILPGRAVYVSTSGVYGDCGGAWVAETRTARPESERAQRRLDAERQLRAFARRSGTQVTTLRAPGIYARERLPLERLKRRIPALLAEEDAHTNHIHADDLARLVRAALFRGRPNRVYNANDDSELAMGEYFDRVAAHFGLPSPPRVGRAEAERTLSRELYSFMRESRRLSNARSKRELRCPLQFPTVDFFLASLKEAP